MYSIYQNINTEMMNVAWIPVLNSLKVASKKYNVHNLPYRQFYSTWSVSKNNSSTPNNNRFKKNLTISVDTGSRMSSCTQT